MRLPMALLALVGGLALSVLLYAVSGGRIVFVFLPLLLLGAPLLFRRGR